MELNTNTLETTFTVLGTFLTSLFTLGKYLKSQIGVLSGRIDHLADNFAILDKNLAVQTALLNTIKESIK